MKRTMVLLLMVVVLVVGLALPGTALAARRPAIDIRVTMSASATTASTATVYSGEPVQLHVEAYNASSIALTSFTVEIPKLWWPVFYKPTSGDTDNDFVLDPGEKWQFDIIIDGIINGPCPTKNTTYTADFLGWNKGIDPAVYYYVSNAAQVKVIVTR